MVSPNVQGLRGAWPILTILKGASLNGACGGEPCLQPFSLPSGKSIPRMADYQASAHLPIGLTHTCASSYLSGVDTMLQPSGALVSPLFPILKVEGGILVAQGDGGCHGVKGTCTWNQHLYLGGSGQNQCGILFTGSLPQLLYISDWDGGELTSSF